jgi:hypothetical protein
MRTLVEPPPSSRCEICGGELRLKLIEPVNDIRALANEILVCSGCCREQAYTVHQDTFFAGSGSRRRFG